MNDTMRTWLGRTVVTIYPLTQSLYLNSTILFVVELFDGTTKWIQCFVVYFLAERERDGGRPLLLSCAVDYSGPGRFMFPDSLKRKYWLV